MDNREKLVLDIRPAAADLVEDDRFGAPDGGRGLDVFERPVLARQRKPDQVVEIEKARIVVPELEFERYATDQEERARGDQCPGWIDPPGKFEEGDQNGCERP